MGRKSQHNLSPGIHLDQYGAYWATLEGENAQVWRKRYPGKSLPRRKAKTLKEAKVRQRQLANDLKDVRDPNPENPKVADWTETCIKRKRTLASSTAKRYRTSLKWQIANHTIGKMRIAEVLESHVEDWIDALTKQKRQDDDTRFLDSDTIERAFALLRMVFKIAIKKRMISINPCDGVELPDTENEEISPMTPDQVRHFLTFLKVFNEGKPHRLIAFYYIAIRCGLRLGELIGLRWKDINLEQRELRIAGQMQDGRRQNGKKKRTHRTVPLAADVIEILHIHRQIQNEEQKIAGDGWNKAGLGFCSVNGTALDTHNIWRQFTALQRRANLAEQCVACNATGKQSDVKCAACHGNKSIALFRPHDMRHTYAALAIAAGVDIYTLSRRMGHASIKTTADVYGHLYKGQDDDAIAIARLLERN